MECKEKIFKFKKFNLAHGKSALSVGFDGVLLGAWCDVNRANTILDVGTGCGVIALMCAQRNAFAQITGIDIHLPSINEALGNFSASQWSARLHVAKEDFMTITKPKVCYDLIISNPPFYNAGLMNTNTNARLAARHITEFGPLALIDKGAKLLSAKGSIALICPASYESDIIAQTYKSQMFVRRICRVQSYYNSKPKRILCQVSKQYGDCEHTNLIVYNQKGEYTETYQSLTKDFYLEF